MWGEIVEPVKTQPILTEEELDGGKFELPVKVEIPYPKFAINQPTDPRQQRQDTPRVSRAETTCVNNMVEAIAQSGSPVKSQQIGEPELTLEERKEELLSQYRSRPLVFLERYHASLKPADLSAFAHVCSDPRAQHYSQVIQRRAGDYTDRTRVRNHRYAALRALQREGKYFSEEQMRSRQPLLYEQYIGQYLTDEEILERSQEAMQDNAEETTGSSTAGLAHLLLSSYQEHLIQNRLQEEQEREDGAQEEEEDEEDEDGDSVQRKEEEPTVEEKALLREEFLSQMYQHFLDGKDRDFNYSEVDENPDYDNLDIVSRDAEDKYFDEDDEEYSEEEETMTE
ncbi:coiled-coil domain-containing protein 97 [Takifugu flavidus]|uniref:Coiled-coil domain-containing protein 97 n=1 Tax=Takifugu flavidus TaxID=433684 RepID=A0A5C6NSH1_9TELE|nr:coiled-coil domain-containing protein 97 [Takifugu flavidus]TWW69569.1 Coiled-coil domain-containing protein 97 [Takifugu flavidus]